MKRVVLLLIIILAFGLRLYRLNSPIADWHSWRQADTSAVSRNFLKQGFDLLHPRFDDLSKVASGLDNPQGYRFVEFPFYNLLQAGAFRLFPWFSLEVWGRLVSIFASIGALIFLYLLTQKYLGAQTALLAALFYAILPFNIYYSRAILPEPLMNLAWLGMVYFFDQWISVPNNFSPITYRLSLAVIFAAISFLLKPYTLVFLLPVAYLAWRRWRFNWQKWLAWSLGILAALVPFIAWRVWMQQYPEGIPDFFWLINKTGIRFRGAWWWWLFGERIGRLILGGWGLIPLGIGLILKPAKKEGWFFYACLLAILAYFAIIADGNVHHDYYQVMAVPVLCIFLAKGANFLLTPAGEAFSRFAGYSLLVISLLFLLAFSWYQVRDYFNINNPAIVAAGETADQLLPDEAKVIAPYGGDTAFLYQTKRQGWPIAFDVESLIELGAQYYVSVNFDQQTNQMMDQGRVLQKTDQWVIVDLTKQGS